MGPAGEELMHWPSLAVSCDVNTNGYVALNARFRNCFDILYRNFRSLTTRRFEFYDIFFIDYNVCLTETWLNDSYQITVYFESMIQF
jgi:hypothetical protein